TVHELREVVSRPDREHAHGGHGNSLLRGLEEAVGHLVDRAIPSGRDHRGRAIQRGLPRQLHGMAPALRLPHGKVDAAAGQLPLELTPGPGRSAATGRGVENHVDRCSGSVCNVADLHGRSITIGWTITAHAGHRRDMESTGKALMVCQARAYVNGSPGAVRGPRRSGSRPHRNPGARGSRTARGGARRDRGAARRRPTPSAEPSDASMTWPISGRDPPRPPPPRTTPPPRHPRPPPAPRRAREAPARAGETRVGAA